MIRKKNFSIYTLEPNVLMNESNYFNDFEGVNKNDLLNNNFNFIDDNGELTTEPSMAYKVKSVEDSIIKLLNFTQDQVREIFKNSDVVFTDENGNEYFVFDEKDIANSFLQENILEYIDNYLFVKKYNNDDTYYVIPCHKVYKYYIKNKNYILDKIIKYNKDKIQSEESLKENAIKNINSLTKEETEKVNQLIYYIKKSLSTFYSGELTFSFSTGEFYKIDIKKDENDNFVFNGEDDEFTYFYNTLITSFDMGAGIVITVPTNSYFDKQKDIKYKETYGLRVYLCEQGGFIINTKNCHELANAYSVSSETGEKIGHDPSYIYCDFNGGKIMAQEYL